MMTRLIGASVCAFLVWGALLAAQGQEAAPPAGGGRVDRTAEGQALLEAGRWREALAVFEQAAKDDPSDEQARFGLAAVKMQMGRYAEAFALLEDLRAAYPDSPEILNNIAWIRLKAKDPALHDVPAGLRDARQAVLSAPGNQEAWNTLAEAWYQAGDYEKALKRARIALGIAQEKRLAGIREYERLVERCEKALAGRDATR